MRRRDFVRTSAFIGVSTAIAGCSSSSEDESNGNDNTDTKTESDSQVSDQEIPPPEERNYQILTYDLPIEDPSEWATIGSSAQVIDEEIDRSVYNSVEGFPESTERMFSYVNLELIGTETRDLESGEQDSYKQNLIGLNIDFDISESLDSEAATGLAVAAYEVLGEVEDPNIFYNSGLDENLMKTSALAEVSVNVEHENGATEFSYGHPTNAADGQSIEDLSRAVDSYLEGSEDAIRNEVAEDFNYE